MEENIEPQEYEKMWVDENQNYYDFEPAIINYTTGPKKKYGIGVEHAVICGKDFVAEMHLPKKELKRAEEQGYEFFLNKENFERLVKDLKASVGRMNEVIEDTLQKNFEELSVEEFEELNIRYWQYPEIFSYYNLTQPHFFTKIERELKEKINQKGVEDVNEVIGINEAV